jgi:hypothetical protein
MKKNFIVLLSGFPLIVLFLIIFFFGFQANLGTNSVEKELNKLVNSKDPVAIAQLSETENTKESLMNLPSHTKAERTTDSQGAKWTTNEQGQSVLKVYFVSSLNGQSVSVFMYQDRQSKFYYKLFPKWTIASLRV